MNYQVMPGVAHISIQEVTKAQDINHWVCEYLRIPEAVVHKKSRIPYIVHARNWCIYFISLKTRLIQQDIASIFYETFDRCNIVTAKKKVIEQLTAKHHNDYKEEFEPIQQLIESEYKKKYFQ